jgi:predicted O-linked N-acetylglucosamine transferase (SPINDLY family)
MAAIPIPQAFEYAMQQHRAGRLAEAEVVYRQILAVQPNHADARHLLGVIAHQVGRDEAAVECISQALQLSPVNASAHSNLGEALRGLRRFDEAMASYRRAIELEPRCADFYHNLGVALAETERFEEAIAAFRRALELQPEQVENLGNLGSALADNGQLDEAIAELRKAIALQPNHAESHYKLGVVLSDRHQLDEAAEACRRALALQPGYAEAHNQMGNLLLERGQVEEATNEYRQACALKPGYASAHNNLGNAFWDQGRIDEAVAEFRHALQLRPDNARLHSNLICALHFSPASDQRSIDAEQEIWNRRFGQTVKRPVSAPVRNENPERRLRIGYVSPEFRDHVTGRYLLPLFRQHDTRNFEVYCYSGVINPDSLTDEFRRCAQSWKSTVRIGDAALAEMIRQDEVDILVDLTQHLSGNRLPMFTRQPAPVQVSFAGYPASTGVEQIEYRISDPWLEPSEPAEERAPEALQEAGNIAETVRSLAIGSPMRERVYLIDSFWCYDPCGAEVEVNTPPSQASGTVTFGSLNAFSKVNEVVLKLWAKVLVATPGSRLLLLSPPGSHRERTWALLEQEGAARERVEFVEPRPRKEYLELYHRLDVALDPFPYGGHTTSLDALWMGVPVVTLPGDTSVSRGGLSILRNLGLPELVASSAAEYVRIAAELAGDGQRRAELRATLRERMEKTVLMDEVRFARGIEAAYRKMWRGYCGGS